MLSISLVYPAPAFGLTLGILKLGTSESQFNYTDERDTMVQLAGLGVIRAATCEQRTWKDKCTKQKPECAPDMITICKGPRDVDIQMKKYDNEGDSALHALIYFQLNWDDHSTPFDYIPLSVVKTVGNLNHKVFDVTKRKPASLLRYTKPLLVF